MNLIGMVLISVFLIFLFFFISFYSTLVTARNLCSNKWTKMESELMRRYEIAAYIVDAVKAVSPEQEELLSKVIALRNQARENYGPPGSRAKDENLMIRELRKLFEIAGQYPDLLASHQFQRLQEELIKTEYHIQHERAEYNNNVFDYNDLIDSSPTKHFASYFHFEKREPFDIEMNTIRVTYRVEKPIIEEGE